MLAWILENTAVAALIALALAACGRLLRSRPALAHALWLVALAALVLPPLPLARTPGGELRAGLRELVLGRVEADPAAVEALDGAAGRVDAGAATVVVPAAAAMDHASAAPAPVRPRVTPAAALAFLWLAGALAVLARAAWRVLPFARLVARAPLAPRALRREVAAVARRLGVRAPETRVVAGAVSPSVWCLGRPRLLWPGDTAAITPRARTALIAHELAHLARRDHWVSWLEVPAAALLWWNPLFWWIRGRIRHFAELACDAWAVRAYPADRRSFAEALIDLQARTLTAPVALRGLGATDAECRDFEKRLDMIMQKRVFPRVSRSAAALAVATAVLISPGFSRGGAGGGEGKRAVVESRAESVKLGREAKERLAAQDHAGALRALEEAVALDPANGWAHGRMGYVLIGLGRSEDAKGCFRRQYELGDARPTALYNLACAHALTGDAEGALAHLGAAVRHGFAEAELMAKDPDLASLRADARFEAELARARDAAALRAELAERKGGDVAAFFAVHGELAELATADGALQAFHGHLALRAGEPAAAVVAFGRQAEAGHDVPNALYNRACARARAGDAERALADLERAAAEGLRYAGIAQDADLDAVRALPGYAALEARIVASAEAQMELKRLASTGDEAAIPALAALLADATRPAKERVWAAHALARLQHAADRHAEAFATYEAAAELGADVQGSAFGMAEVLAAVGKREPALRHVELALELGFDDADALAALLEAHALAAPADADALVERAREMRAKKAAYGKEPYAPAKPVQTAKGS